MKKQILLIIITTALFSQEAEISNIQAAQRTDGSQIVDIYYDLLPDQFFQVFTISLEIGLGNSFIEITGLSGDVGQGIIPGDELKHIIWDAGNHSVFNDSFFDNLTVRITGESVIVEEFPFEMVSMPPESFNNDCQTQLDYGYSIMLNAVTNAEYAEFLIDLLQEGDEIYIGDGDTTLVMGHYSGGGFIEPGNYGFYQRYGDISWTGVTFVVEEGTGENPVLHATWIGAQVFAQYYGLRVPLIEEIINARTSINIDDTTGEWINAFMSGMSSSSGCSSYTENGNFPNLGFRCAGNQ